MTPKEYNSKLETLKKQELELTREFIEDNPFKELEGKCPEDRDLQAENRAQRIVIQNIEEDYNNLKLLLRCKYPKIWKEFINMDSSAIEKLKGNFPKPTEPIRQYPHIGMPGPTMKIYSTPSAMEKHLLIQNQQAIEKNE